MSELQVTISTLTSQADELAALNGQFKASIEQLISFENDLNSMWDGEANDAFHTAFTNDQGKMNEFYNLVLQYIEKLRMIAQRYADAEASNAQIASQRTY